MSDKIFGGIVILLLGLILFIATCVNARKIAEKRRIKDSGLVNKLYNSISVAIFCGFFLATGVIATGYGIIEDQTVSVEQLCGEHAICYELVQTVAQYTEYTEDEVVNFFIIVSNSNIEAYDAIKMLDSSLTDEQIHAIMEISAMKQAE